MGQPGATIEARRRTPLRRRWRLAAFAALITGVYLVNNNASPLGDAAAAVPVAVSIVHDGDITLDELRPVHEFASGGWVSEHDGHLVPFFPWAVGVFAIPTVLAADALGALGIGPGAGEWTRAMGRAHAVLQAVTATGVTVLAALAVRELARLRLRAHPERATAVATVFALGTSAWSTSSRLLWQHGPSMACTAWALVLVARGRLDARRGAATGALLAAAFAVRPTNALLGAGMLVLLLVGRQRRATAGFAVAAAALLAPWAAVNRAVYGSWLQPYGSTSRLGLHDAFAEAVAANLISSGRGLFVFSPVALVAVAGAARIARRPDERDPVHVLAAAVVLTHLLVISALPHWTGGYSYGPRLFTDVLPLLVVLALPAVDALAPLRSPTAGVPRARATLVVVALAVVSVGVHAQRALVIGTRCWSVMPVSVDDDYRRVWSLDDPLVTAGARYVLRNPMAALSGRCDLLGDRAGGAGQPAGAVVGGTLDGAGGTVVVVAAPSRSNTGAT